MKPKTRVITAYVGAKDPTPPAAPENCAFGGRWRKKDLLKSYAKRYTIALPVDATAEERLAYEKTVAKSENRQKSQPGTRDLFIPGDATAGERSAYPKAWDTVC